MDFVLKVKETTKEDTMIFLIIAAAFIYLFIVYNPVLFIFGAVVIGCAVLAQIANISSWRNS